MNHLEYNICLFKSTVIMQTGLWGIKVRVGSFNR